MKIIAIGAVLLAAAGLVRPAQPPDTSARAVVARAAERQATVQKALEFVLADETAVQEVFDEDGRRAARRETSGDFFLAFVPGDGGWLAVRDLTTVDGTPVENRDDLRALLTRGSMARIGRALADRNARFNIGPVVRNFNDPMLALVILDDKHRTRFRFERRSVARQGTSTLVTLAFTERDRPTLIRGGNNAPVFTRGELVIDAEAGHLHRAVITMKDGPTSAELTTTFERVEKLDLWLPARMDERYEHRSARERATVTVTSTYANYRRFEATGRIKRP